MVGFSEGAGSTFHRRKEALRQMIPGVEMQDLPTRLGSQAEICLAGIILAGGKILLVPLSSVSIHGVMGSTRAHLNQIIGISQGLLRIL